MALPKVRKNKNEGDFSSNGAPTNWHPNWWKIGLGIIGIIWIGIGIAFVLTW